MAITLRTVKGSTLTYTEVDTNFSSLFYSASVSSDTISLFYTSSGLTPTPNPVTLTVAANSLWTASLDGRISRLGQVDVTGSVIVSGTLRVGSTIVTGAPTWGSTPNAVVGEFTGGVLDVRNTNTAIVGGDTLGIIQFTGKDDASVAYTTAKIQVTTNSNIGSGDGGGSNIKFYTSTGGTGVQPTERIAILASGDINITGSLLIKDLMVLAPRTTTPTPSPGMIIVSGSGADQHIYCYLNSTWKQLD